MASITCNMNAGMERLLPFQEGGNPVNISADANLAVFIDIVNPNTASEQRFLRVVEKSTGIEKRKVRLNNRGGSKPLNGNTAMYEPRRRYNPRCDCPVNIDEERAFFSEINLSADPAWEVYLRIDVYTDLEDHRRYLDFVPTALTPLTDDLTPIDLGRGKKPLGGGDD